MNSARNTSTTRIKHGDKTCFVFSSVCNVNTVYMQKLYFSNYVKINSFFYLDRQRVVLSWGFGLYVFQITLTVIDIDNDRTKDYGNWTPQSNNSFKSN